MIVLYLAFRLIIHSLHFLFKFACKNLYKRLFFWGFFVLQEKMDHSYSLSSKQTQPENRDDHSYAALPEKSRVENGQVRFCYIYFRKISHH